MGKHVQAATAAIGERRYKVFISYRHADNQQQGRQWASWLQQTIETYEVPADLVGKINSRGDVIPERIFPVFRDEEELSADSDLSNSIVQALDRSDHLIVICSPRAVASPYVAQELTYFKQIGKGEHLLAMIVDGEPNHPDQECFPEPLRFDTQDDGTLVPARAEPIAADFRVKAAEGTAEGWTTPEAYRHLLQSQGQSGDTVKTQVDAYHQQHELMKLKMISGILDIPLAELSKRDQAYQAELARRKARTLRRWLTAVGVLALVAIVSGIFAWTKKQEAVKQEIQATQKYSLQLTASGLDNLKEGRTAEGMAGLLRSLRVWSGNTVGRDRLMFELAYRDWLMPVQRLTPLPKLEPQYDNPALRHWSDVKVEAADGQRIRLLQQSNQETDSGGSGYEDRRQRQLVWQPESAEWQVGNVVSKRALSEAGHQKLILPDGRIIESFPHEVKMGQSSVAVQNATGEYLSTLEARGVIALSTDRRTFVVAGDSGHDVSNVHLHFFDAKSLQEVGWMLVPVSDDTDVRKVLWEDDHLLLVSHVQSRRFERLDWFRIERKGGAIKTQSVLTNQLIPGKHWDFEAGSLFVFRDDGIARYQPLAPQLPAKLQQTNAYDVPLAWQPWSRLEKDSFFSETGWKQLHSRSASGLKAQFQDERTLVFSKESGVVIKSLQMALRQQVGEYDFKGMGFAPQDERLGLVSQRWVDESDDRFTWEVYDTDSGLVLFPDSTRFYSFSESAHLRGAFERVEARGWSADGRKLVFQAATARGITQQEAEQGVLQPLWTNAANQQRVMALPVRWSERDVPAWFMDVVERLLPLHQDAVRGMALSPLAEQAFQQIVRDAVAAHDGSADQEYVDFLKGWIR